MATPYVFSGGEALAFEVVETKTVFKGRSFDVRVDQLRLPDGQLHKLDIIDHRDAVTMLPVDENGFIWFIRQYRHPAGRELLELPAGMLEGDEAPQVGALREIREEIGMSAGSLRKIGGFFLAPGYSTEYMHIFLATQLHSDPLPGDVDEFLSVEKIPISQAFELAQSGQIQDAKSLTALFLAQPYFGK